jgi:hypothetical protein
MTPDEFNKVGTQVQLNIFEKYEDDLNQQYRMPQNDTEYANRVKNIEQKLQFFQRTGATTYSAVNGNFTLTPTDIYRLGSVYYNGEELTQYSQRNEITQLLLSPLTKPTTDFPVYLYEQDLLYPTTIQTGVTISYLKKPADINWGYSVGALGQFLYNSAGSVDFELSVTEQTNVVTRILAYAGVIINDPTIIQVAAQEIAQEEQNSKM